MPGDPVSLREAQTPDAARMRQIGGVGNGGRRIKAGQNRLRLREE
jgi:hypothetical protein